MALSIDQTLGLSVDDNVSSSAHSFGTGPTAGSTVFVLASIYNGTASDTHALGTGSVTDNQGNTYTLLQEQNYSLDTKQWAAVYSANNVSSSGTFTITLTGRASSYFTWGAVSVKGWAGTPTKDVTSGKDNPNTATIDSGSVTTTGTSEVALAVSGLASQPITLTGPSGYTQLWQDITATDSDGEGDYKLLTATSTEDPTWTTTGQGTPGGVAVIATVKDVVSGAVAHLLTCLGVGK